MFPLQTVHKQTNHSKGEFVNRLNKTNTINEPRTLSLCGTEFEELEMLKEFVDSIDISVYASTKIDTLKFLRLKFRYSILLHFFTAMF